MSYNSLLDGIKLNSVREICLAVADRSEDIVEIGVYRGGSAKLFSEYAGESTVHLIDTFAGIPHSSEHDNVHVVGDFSDVVLDDVKSYVDGENCRFHVGSFPSEIDLDQFRETRFKIVHIDCDVYQSYVDCLEFFYPKLIEGGYLILDDYAADSCLGAKLAVDEYFSEHNLRIDGVVSTQAVHRKPFGE